MKSCAERDALVGFANGDALVGFADGDALVGFADGDALVGFADGDALVGFADGDALVGFADGTGLWWLRGLRPGFRHCFVALRDGPFWIVLDPLSHFTRTQIVAHDDLAGYYAANGITVLATRVREPPLRPAPWRPFTCVEMVKRVLGVHAPRVLTPWQLYLFLKK